jgi:hypothetical protein
VSFLLTSSNTFFLYVCAYGVERYAKFVKQFADLSVGIDGMKQYDKEVKAGAFPAEAIIQHIVIHQYLSVCIFACSNTNNWNV